jgi:hypothetical protein
MSPTPIAWIPFDEKNKATVRRGSHNMSGKVLHWRYCRNCGLIALKNDVSRKAIAKQCEWLEDP